MVVTTVLPPSGNWVLFHMLMRTLQRFPDMVPVPLWSGTGVKVRDGVSLLSFVSGGIGKIARRMSNTMMLTTTEIHN